MKIMPMGDYYVWHCDWCDSTNYTIWTRLNGEGFVCAACHHKASGYTDNSVVCNGQIMPDRGMHMPHCRHSNLL